MSAILHRDASNCLGLKGVRILIWAVLLLGLLGCGGNLNNPYPREDWRANILYSSFSERPKHLDPARSYSSNEYAFIGQIYEPPLQYHYLKRPYELTPLTAKRLPQPEFYDAEGRRLADDVAPEQVAYTLYTIEIRPGIRYQPHPAFARDAQGRLLYHGLDADDLAEVYSLADFSETGTRELVAADYVHQIKRLAHPSLHSPILGVMSDYIVGLGELANTLRQQARGGFIDLTEYELEGARVLDRYRYQIKVRGTYPQLLYWLAMPFFAPMPPEVERFYAQPGMKEKNLTLDWYPVGTGAYMLTENNPNRRMVLVRNPNYRGMPYPREGGPGDAELGLLADAGKPMPFIDKVVYNLEKETIPYWNKFLQGYYDTSGISSESFDQAVQIGGQGEITLTPEMQQKGIRLLTTVATSIFYIGFNMKDPVVGGLSERARKLRRALSIAIDFEEFISIFANGRGISAQGPIPPGIFGHRDEFNPYVYEQRDGRVRRKSLEEARRLLAEAGYPNGVDERTGKPLTLYLDITASGPDDKARLNWYRKQFQKLNIQLVIRNTLYNRFQEKMLNGTAQIFIWGWNADYPDPENFLFLLYGPNGKADHRGENAANYANPEFDRLFEHMKNMRNGPERQAIIDRMVEIVRRDAPWVWGFHPKLFGLYHEWYYNAKPNLMGHNTLQYRRIDPDLRAERRAEWNRPVWWPLWLLLGLLVLGTVPAALAYWRKEHQTPPRQEPPPC